MTVLQPALRIGIAAMAITVAAAGPSAAVATQDPSLSTIRIGNFGQIDPHYFRGAQPTARDYPALAAIGVKTVIDLREDFVANEERLVKEAGMQFRRIPMDEDERPADASVEAFLDIVNDPANMPVYVHCKGGRHRTGLMTAIYRLTHHDWSAERAYEEMKDYHFKVPLNFLFGHHELKDYVFDYYEDLQSAAAGASTGR
jgi:protein tyrosine/serine phosphatase